jgi:molecular chaperone DnaK (HSP70)
VSQKTCAYADVECPDVSIVSIEDGVFEVLATAGDTHLGCEDFDQNVVDYFVKKYNKDNSVDVREVGSVFAITLEYCTDMLAGCEDHGQTQA